MFTVSKALIAAAALLSTTAPAFAQDAITAEFRYDRTLSVEQNYAAFARTAKRACDDISPMVGARGQNKCRASLIEQAVAASKVGELIAYHGTQSGELRKVAVLDRR